MTVETTTKITELVTSSPADTGEPRREGAAQIRLLKAVLKATFPNLDGAVTPTPAVLNGLPARMNMTELDIAGILTGTKNFTGDIRIAKNNAALRLQRTSTNYAMLRQSTPSGNLMLVQHRTATGAAWVDIDAIPLDETSNSTIRIWRWANTSGLCRLDFGKGDGGASDVVAARIQLNDARNGLKMSGHMEFFGELYSYAPITHESQVITKGAVDAKVDPAFTSAPTSLASGSVTLAHGLNTAPSEVRWYLICDTIDLSHAVGDRIFDLSFQTENDNDGGILVVANATNIKFLFKNIRILSSTTTGPSSITPARWSVVLRAWV
jgi:hypothetical protein